MKFCCCGSRTATDIIDSLEDNETQLDISSIPVTNNDLKALKASSRSHQVTHIHLNWCGVTDSLCESITQWLSPPSNITTINLIGNKIKDQGAYQLAKALRQDGNIITYLSVSVNKITKEGFVHILKAGTSEASSLQDLRIGGNRIKLGTSAELEEFYGVGCLTFVDLRGNPTESKVITHVMRGFATGHNLSSVVPAARLPIKRHRLVASSTAELPQIDDLDDTPVEICIGDSPENSQTITPVAHSPAEDVHGTYSQDLTINKQTEGTAEHSINPEYSLDDTNDELCKETPRAPMSENLTDVQKTKDADIPEWSDSNFDSSARKNPPSPHVDGDMQLADSQPDWSTKSNTFDINTTDPLPAIVPDTENPSPGSEQPPESLTPITNTERSRIEAQVSADSIPETDDQKKEEIVQEWSDAAPATGSGEPDVSNVPDGEIPVTVTEGAGPEWDASRNEAGDEGSQSHGVSKEHVPEWNGPEDGNTQHVVSGDFEIHADPASVHSDYVTEEVAPEWDAPRKEDDGGGNQSREVPKDDVLEWNKPEDGNQVIGEGLDIHADPVSVPTDVVTEVVPEWDASRNEGDGGSQSHEVSKEHVPEWNGPEDGNTQHVGDEGLDIHVDPVPATRQTGDHMIVEDTHSWEGSPNWSEPNAVAASPVAISVVDKANNDEPIPDVEQHPKGESHQDSHKVSDDVIELKGAIPEWDSHNKADTQQVDSDHSTRQPPDAPSNVNILNNDESTGDEQVPKWDAFHNESDDAAKIPPVDWTGDAATEEVVREWNKDETPVEVPTNNTNDVASVDLQSQPHDWKSSVHVEEWATNFDQQSVPQREEKSVRITQQVYAVQETSTELAWSASVAETETRHEAEWPAFDMEGGDGDGDDGNDDLVNEIVRMEKLQTGT
eukprot:TRINITY_DN441_c0_g1_i1.p1 TRINITY_DN441_c0_g1~~TRINITY_DN441_c0_g1_i1.p1  ORF type:complete len:896 (+),score=198.65 TRINITY_DN441_c0_g1_i1:74-2761(+)